ncbi:MAG: hypothetical protein KAI66_26860 [Lentisphaeria bacterium]|nr:hypothetical protein [Lentisphaeria bacterium]
MFRHDALRTIEGYQSTISEAFPSLKMQCFLFNGSFVCGVYEDKNAPRILLALWGDPQQAQIKRNGEVMEEEPGAAEVAVAVALHKWGGKIVDDPDGDHHVMRLGYWIPLKRTDRFEMTGRYDHPAKSEFRITYDPDRRWGGTMSPPERDELRIKPGDAYEISLEPLVGRVIEVLEEKGTCQVNLKRRQSVTLRTWDEEDANKIGNIQSLCLTVEEAISINMGPAREKLTPPGLEQRLEMYASAVRAGDRVPVVRLRVGANASDDLFCEVFRALLHESIDQHIFLEVLRPAKKKRSESKGSG